MNKPINLAYDPSSRWPSFVLQQCFHAHMQGNEMIPLNKGIEYSTFPKSQWFRVNIRGSFPSVFLVLIHPPCHLCPYHHHLYVYTHRCEFHRRSTRGISMPTRPVPPPPTTTASTVTKVQVHGPEASTRRGCSWNQKRRKKVVTYHNVCKQRPLTHTSDSVSWEGSQKEIICRENPSQVLGN